VNIIYAVSNMCIVVEITHIITFDIGYYDNVFFLFLLYLLRKMSFLLFIFFFHLFVLFLIYLLCVTQAFYKHVT